MAQTGYLAHPDLKDQLKGELKNIIQEYDRLILCEGPPQPAHWAQNIWFDPQIIPFTSISDGAKKLKALQKLWVFYPISHIRRAGLIAESLSYFTPKPFAFPSSMPTTPLGSWTLLNAQTILASPRCSSPFAHGEVLFQETKIPPSRAYLKLWEALTIAGKMPGKDDLCLEIGASPGSWTWVIQQLGAQVVAIDRAALDPAISSLPNVTFMKKDAFSIGPKGFPNLTWIFSDVICYPEKLLSWVKQWVDNGLRVNFICTLKFQGNEGYQIAKEFEKIEGSQVLHLYNNKHELTWIYLTP